MVASILADHTALPTTLDAAQRAKLDELRKLDGRDFEHAFQQAQLEAHQTFIADFTKASTDCADADLRAWAENA